MSFVTGTSVSKTSLRRLRYLQMNQINLQKGYRPATTRENVIELGRTYAWFTKLFNLWGGLAIALSIGEAYAFAGIWRKP